MIIMLTFSIETTHPAAVYDFDLLLILLIIIVYILNISDNNYKCNIYIDLANIINIISDKAIDIKKLVVYHKVFILY